MKKMIRLTLFLSFLLPFTGQVYAQTVGKISIQGVLRGSTGASVPDGQYMVTFRLYDAVTGGNLQWTENATLNVVAGVYSHYLGNMTPLDMLDFKSKYFLEVQVGTAVMTPRTEIPYAPYSLSVAFSDTVETVVCSGAVGDVKYSILEPAQFAEENGDCWVPMDGRTLAVNDTLRKKWAVKKLPDAGGMFLRGHELPGHEEIDLHVLVPIFPPNLFFIPIDPDRTPATPTALVQMDEIGSHDHDITDPGHEHDYEIRDYDSNDADGSGEFTLLRPPSIFIPTTPLTTERAFTGISVQKSGGAESRPKNLSLYTYIRVN
jgi:hypothetical protein